MEIIITLGSNDAVDIRRKHPRIQLTWISLARGKICEGRSMRCNRPVGNPQVGPGIPLCQRRIGSTAAHHDP